MRKIGKIERINNILFATVLFALALFMFVYEYAAIGAYAGTLEQEERAGFAVAMIIMYIFYYVFGGFCLIVDAVCTFAFTMSLKNVLLNNGESKVISIPNIHITGVVKSTANKVVINVDLILP